MLTTIGREWFAIDSRLAPNRKLAVFTPDVKNARQHGQIGRRKRKTARFHASWVNTMTPMPNTFIQIEAGAHGGAFGDNPMPTPTDAQCKAGNYKLGRITLQGMSIAIEQPRGTYRTGMDADGKRWSSRMAAHYGYFAGTKGNDGDEVDCFVGFYPQSELAFVVNQNVGGRFDEHKAMLAFPDEESARRAYTDSYERGWPGLASIVPASISQLKWWLKNGNMTRPLKPEHLPHEGLEAMTRRTQWSADALPYDQTLDQVLYEIRRSDGGDGLLLDSVSMADILEDSDGAYILDAMVVPMAGLERKMTAMQRVMERAGQTVKPVAVQVTEPFTQRGVANVAAIFELSDGQTVSIYFHNPDTTPKKMAPTDELISWKWLLNKKDITIVVAPEHGEDLNVNEVARRIMKLAEKNSAAFVRANGKRAERMQHLADLNTEIAGLETELKAAQNDLEAAKIEAEDRAAAQPTPAPATQPTAQADYERLSAQNPGAILLYRMGDFYEVLGKDAAAVAGVLELTLTRRTAAGGGAPVPMAGIPANALERNIEALKGAGYAVVVAERDTNGIGQIVQPAPAPAPTTMTEKEAASDAALRALWTEQGVPQARQDELMAQIVAKAQPGASVGPFVIGEDSPPPASTSPLSDALKRGELTAAVALLNGMSLKDMQGALLYSGFSVPSGSKKEILAYVSPKLIEAAMKKTDGFGLRPQTEVVAPADVLLHTFPGEDNMQAEVRSRPDGKFGVLLRDLDSGNVVAGISILSDKEKAITHAKSLVAVEDDFLPDGRESKVKTAKGTEVVTGFAVVDAARLITSHDPASGDVNPEFPQELQPRDRGRETSRAWVLKTAANLDPEQLGKTRRADTGAPIVGKDRVVESGNGRTMAIIEAYRTGKADEYRVWLESEADYFGLSADRIKGMKRPVLVRVRTSQINRAEFAVEANQDDKLAMTATEKARADANRLTDDMIGLMTDNGDLNAAANTRFLSAFLSSLGDAEAAQYSTSEGKPTSSLIARVQAAIFAKAYNDDRLLELTADSVKPEIANIISALNFAAPEFIQSAALDPLTAGGATKKLTDAIEASLNEQAVAAIIGATNVIKQAKESGMQVDEFIKQQGLFGDLDPSVAAMAVFIAKNNRSAKRMGAAFKAMATFVKGEIERRQTADMFGEPVPIGFPEIIAAANRELDRAFGEGAFAIETVDLFARPVEPPAAQVIPATVRTQVENALSSLRQIRDAIANAKALDVKFGAAGRYESEALENNKAAIDSARKKLTTFRQHAPGNGIDAEAVIASMGGEPDLTPSAAALAWAQGGAAPAPTPAPTEDPQMTQDRALFQSVIDGTVTTPDGEGILSATLADTLEAAYLRHAGNADMDALFEKAINAYTEAEVAASANL